MQLEHPVGPPGRRPRCGWRAGTPCRPPPGRPPPASSPRPTPGSGGRWARRPPGPRGRPTAARARAARCCSPSETSLGNRSPRWSMPRRAISSRGSSAPSTRPRRSRRSGRHVLGHGQLVEQARATGAASASSAPRAPVGAGGRRPSSSDRPGVGPLPPGDDREQRGLARAGAPGHRHDLARLDGQVDPGQHLAAAARAGERLRPRPPARRPARPPRRARATGHDGHATTMPSRSVDDVVGRVDHRRVVGADDQRRAPVDQAAHGVDQGGAGGARRAGPSARRPAAASGSPMAAAAKATRCCSPPDSSAG